MWYMVVNVVCLIMRSFLQQIAIGMLSAAILSGCAVTPSAKSPPTLKKLMKNKQIVSIPYRFYGKGIFMIRLNLDGQEDMNFLVDTGATQSALYRSAVSRLGLEELENASISVHGMVQSGQRPVVVVPSIAVGDRSIENVRMAVLKNRIINDTAGPRPDGLIGMDILNEYRIYVDAETQTFNLIPRALPAPEIPWQWKTVELMSNPFIEDGHDLHFLKIRLGNHQLPALLDSGSEDNLMNWSDKKFPQLRFAKRKLRERWVLEGAIGKFDPHYLINAKDLRSGGKFWKESRFIVMNFEGLEILGIKDQPFAIAGSPLLARETFYLDFAENIIKFKPSLYEVNKDIPGVQMQRLGTKIKRKRELQ